MATLKTPVTPNDHIRGRNNANAPVTLVEYGDYECPHCGAAHGVVKELFQHFGEDMCYVFRHFPLQQMHPYAEPAAETAELAGAHEKFWEMHDLIYTNQDFLSMNMLLELSVELGLPPSHLKEAIQNHTYQDKIRGDFLSGVRSGVNGTPTFFINGYRHNGSYAFEVLANAIAGEVMPLVGAL
jgi:protein-disulfide isomerase